jgi:tetratricopeptide (TPR) repeat protein
MRKYWWLALVLAGVALLAWTVTGPEWSRPRTGKASDMAPLPGYIMNFETVTQEYLRYNGKPLKDDAMAAQFNLAAQDMAKRDYGSAADLLEGIVKKAAVPAVFNNLGVIYLAQNDRGNAVNAFREALSRDIEYQQVRQNMDRMKELGLDNAGPLLHEIEANNTLLQANIIAPGKPVEGEIMAAVNDIDSFKVTSPPAPRDTISIEVVPRSRMLEPMIKVFDAERHMLQWVKGKDAPGKSISFVMAPAPNTALYLQVSGFADSAGLYTLKVTPLKAFDAYEPNDEVFNARAIELGKSIDANIMDKSDTDYYSFEAPKAGKVKVAIHNRSATLLPALTTFNPEMRSTGFGPDVRTPGANLEHSFEVEANKKYFVQVWSQSNTAGEYSLTISQ